MQNSEFLKTHAQIIYNPNKLRSLASRISGENADGE